MDQLFVKIIIIIIYLGVVGFLGFLGWRRTKNTQDYMLGGRRIHPAIMALSYGATFISTSAIVGFRRKRGCVRIQPAVADISQHIPRRVYRVYIFR